MRVSIVFVSFVSYTWRIWDVESPGVFQTTQMPPTRFDSTSRSRSRSVEASWTRPVGLIGGSRVFRRRLGYKWLCGNVRRVSRARYDVQLSSTEAGYRLQLKSTDPHWSTWVELSRVELTRVVLSQPEGTRVIWMSLADEFSLPTCWPMPTRQKQFKKDLTDFLAT